MPSPFRVQRRVEFRDTDAAGIVHFSAFFLYMEQAEHEWLRQLGLSVLMRDAEGTISWPRVAVRCDYRGVVQFEDMLDIELSVARLGTKSVTYGFRFLKGDQLVAEGEVTSVCCRIRDSQPPESIPIPVAIRTKLATACPATSNV